MMPLLNANLLWSKSSQLLQISIPICFSGSQSYLLVIGLFSLNYKKGYMFSYQPLTLTLKTTNTMISYFSLCVVLNYLLSFTKQCLNSQISISFSLTGKDLNFSIIIKETKSKELMPGGPYSLSMSSMRCKSTNSLALNSLFCSMHSSWKGQVGNTQPLMTPS